MNDEELNAWAETLEILKDAETMQAVHEADEELANGQTLSFEQVFVVNNPIIRSNIAPH